MRSSNKDQLKAKVAAVNRANGVALSLQPVLRAIFEPLVGEKILKADGTFLAKVAALMPELPSQHDLMVYRLAGNYSLAWSVKTNEHDSPQTVLYHEATLYVGNLEGQILKSMADHRFDGRVDYTVEEIEAKREAYSKAKRISDEAREALYPFGE